MLQGLLPNGSPLDPVSVPSLSSQSSSQLAISVPKLSVPRKNQTDMAFARWLVKSARPHTLGERDMPFADFISTLVSDAWKPPDFRNVQANILRMSAAGQSRAGEFLLQMSEERIKPSMGGDIWGDRGCSILGIMGYGIDSTWTMREYLLAATPFYTQRHTGDAIDAMTLDAFKLLGDGVDKWTSEADVYEGIHGKVSDNGSNMKKGWKGFDGGFCFAHTLELVIQKYTNHDKLKPTFDRMRGITGFFNKSATAVHQLKAIQEEFNLPSRKPIQVSPYPSSPHIYPQICRHPLPAPPPVPPSPFLLLF